MQYMGGKARIAKQIVDTIRADTRQRDLWVEPFVGGANVTMKAAQHWRTLQCFDAHPDLILLWQALQTGWVPPDDLDEYDYQYYKQCEPSALRGLVGFGASFGGKWWGGFGVSSTNGPLYPINRRNVLRQAAVFQRCDAAFACTPFHLLTMPPPSAVVYCDPPYHGTEDYAHGLHVSGMYLTLRAWAEAGCTVYVSEYKEPEHVPVQRVWEAQKRITLNNSDVYATELLFRVLP